MRSLFKEYAALLLKIYSSNNRWGHPNKLIKLYQIEASWQMSLKRWYPIFFNYKKPLKKLPLRLLKYGVILIQRLSKTIFYFNIFYLSPELQLRLLCTQQMLSFFFS